ncbi:MAG: hypothetical protein ABI551_01305 [Polyangiaceae bacterium]
MRSSWLLVASAISLVACSKDWSERELVPVVVSLGSSGAVTVSMPSGLKRTSKEGVLAIYESETADGPLIYVVALTASDDTADSYIAGSKDGSDFEKRDVPGGFGIAYQSDGPLVHVVKKLGSKFLTCDASFPGGTKGGAKRADLIWRICTSMK